MKFSIIVPTYNTEKYIKSCLNSLINQQLGNYEKEVVLVDDCSTDNTYQILKEFRDNNKEWVKLFKNAKNIGVGPARNIGIENAFGEWLLFLDSDDKLSSNALKELSEYISINSSLDIVGYNWVYDLNSDIKSEKYGERWDLNSLLKSKNELIKEYVSLGMDNSVIYALMKKNLLDSNKLRFREGFHEDVDFLFKAYFYANKIGVLNLPLYFKNNRKGSIINTISECHIKNFFRAFKEIYLFLNSKNIVNEEIGKYYYRGILRLVATEVRYIWQGYISENQADKLYFTVYNEYVNLLKDCNMSQSDIKKRLYEPKYMMITGNFLKIMADKPESVCKEMAGYLEEIKEKSWSCYELHNSLFLAPDEIRTCCKRFFVGNKMKGDVVLLDSSKYNCNEFTPENILKEKKDLHVRINRGMAEECMGCPYLVFKNWKPINELTIEYISFEYSTVCNMRCNYCSDKYFAGKKAEYNVELLLNQLFEKGSLRPCNTIVWGGGEPTLDNIFNKLLAFMASNFPNVKQRIFTNATGFSDVVDKLIKEDKVLSITSIDAGNEENFYKIRRHKGFKKVLENLKKYSLSKPENMIIKYILTKDNSSLEELIAYVKYVQEYSLERCNFQISFDFTEEVVGFDSLISAIALHTYLSDINVRIVFFDDLFWQRISNELNAHYDKVLEKLKELNLQRAFVEKEKYKSVVIWGAGIQAKFLIEKSAFFKKVKIDYLVDNSVEKVGKDYFGYKVLSPEVLLDSDFPVLIAAVQNVPNILDNFYKLGLNESRLIKGLII